ncbi:MAG: 6,7-dimethyl-8-ribityllumazine synthase [Planctomycetes bacterium]|nr:6,7-dimethyl-8-ribityllumazine synthase [Planctomycetota bacterium]
MTIISGTMDASGRRFGVVTARFNDFITSRLVEGAVDALVRHGAKADQLVQVLVPGAWEIPLAAKKLAETGKYDAVICLGCVIRGQTPHFEYVAGEAAKGTAQVSLSTGVPISFGIVTADTLEQAIDRAGGKAGNKGADAALAAIEMVNALAGLPR